MNNYDSNINVAHKFNLKGLVPKDTFLGCLECRKIYAVNAVGVLECGNCLGRLKKYTVTEFDMGMARVALEGDFAGGDNDYYFSSEESA